MRTLSAGIVMALAPVPNERVTAVWTPPFEQTLIVPKNFGSIDRDDGISEWRTRQ